MGPIEIGKRRLYFLLAACTVTFLLYNLLAFSSNPADDGVRVPINKAGPHSSEPYIPDNEDQAWDDDYPPIPNFDSNPPVGDEIKSDPLPEVPAAKPDTWQPDAHPIANLMKEADAKWREYEGSRSETFRQTVEKYRSKYGRHPPPGFKEWYIYARRKNVWNIDDFDHIMDDLRPFWAIEPRVMRTYAAHMWENPDHGVASIHIRNGTVARVDRGSWRSETMVEVINLFVENLPDMDISMNRLDQPRLLVPWEDLQGFLETEQKTRVMPPEASYNFTTNQDRFTNLTHPVDFIDESEERFSAEWFGHSGKQYMDIASKACPPESPARAGLSIADADAMYKEPTTGLVTNFNLSSDLCTVGPTLHNLHGFLYTASSISASHKLVPIFSECKVNVNNDIMFPANMYWRHDKRYDYDPTEDLDWRGKTDTMIWRGVTSGGAQLKDNWQTMHRQRLVQLMNGTHMSLTNQNVTILSKDNNKAGFSPFADLGMPSKPSTYHNTSFHPSSFAEKVSDIGFVESWGCIPDCSFYDTIFSWKPQTSLTAQFRAKYLIDVDGHSFSGRWHAFLLSKSLGFKATIFREWHDSRLFPWRHFVPVDNRYDDLYALLTYFVGYGTSPAQQQSLPDSPSTPESTQSENIYIPDHQAEAKTLARQGREWANKVLRRDDIEVYMYRLLLEYGRIIDDNRDHIGYSGDGSELDRFDAGGSDGISTSGEATVSDDGASGKGRWGIGGWFGGRPAGPQPGIDHGPGGIGD